MSKAHLVIVRIHRVAAILFLLAIAPAWWASARGGEPAAFVYLPLPFLFVLVATGIYQLVLPWVRRARTRRSS